MSYLIKCPACSIDFFCDNCNKLLSKKKIDFRVTAIEDDKDEGID